MAKGRLQCIKVWTAHELPLLQQRSGWPYFWKYLWLYHDDKYWMEYPIRDGESVGVLEKMRSIYEGYRHGQ